MKGRLFLWAWAIEHKAPGVNFNHPPRTSDFHLEPYAIATVKEITFSTSSKDEEEVDNLAIDHETATAPQENHTENNKVTALARAQKKAPKICPVNHLAGAQKKGPSDSNSSPKRIYTPVRKLPNGQYLAPWLIPNSNKAHTPASKDLLGHSRDNPVILNVDDQLNPASPADHDGLATPNASGDQTLESKDNPSGNSESKQAGHKPTD
ncbi:hypothetical protein PCANC_16642 [Puccinia coronata f. sp. avenae]|uniref:Uncharacterized protein n=1 Tax=Puccinia coronata f. sp. avenae TaxID=200324 RepID=A0A2N5T3T8_9BASI|nr:hypothetical protein PCANC_16642 [Puccinia coronata f. sp. avenae]